VILFLGGRSLFAPTTSAVAFFEGSVGGLSPGAPVTFRGVRVGTVSRVALVLDTTDMHARIPVYLRLEPDQVRLGGPSKHLPMMRQLIQAGLRAKLVPESLVTGQMLVELDLDPRSPAEFVGTADSGIPEIPSEPSDLQALRRELTSAPIAQTVAQARRTLVAIETVARDVDAVILPLSTNADRTLDTARRTMAVAATAITQVQNDASTSLHGIDELVTEGRGQVGARGQDLSRSLQAFERTMRAATQLIGSVDSLVAVRTQSRSDLEATLRDISVTAGNLRDLSETAERDPSVLLRGRPSR